jgi:2-hydroxychromene-2-carboxylate isomerase|tara:strand:+ start:127 stop:387 length:261 start_codon:yes stop_codon:yes gene_type:complete
MKMRLLGAEAACGTTVGAASTFLNSNYVRIFNNTATVQVVTIANAADVTLGSIKVAAFGSEIVYKETSDQIFAAVATVFGTPVFVD